jgi:phenylacetate-CoA ligase
MEWTFQSAVPGIVWPAVSATQAAAKLALLHQLEQSQWFSAERVRELQLHQADVLLRHAVATVPHYRARFGATVSAADFADLPLLTAREVQEKQEELKSERIPAEHGAVAEARTSGSTGSPKRVLKTQLSQLFWHALTLREHFWHRRDFAGKLAVIRRGAEGTSASWGPATAGVVATGPAVGLDLDMDLDAQLDWVHGQNPTYLLTYPSVLGGLARTALARGIRLPLLRQARTISEIVFAETRDLCRRAWGVPLADLYSSEEIGTIALQCPDHEHYHVQAETVVVEILDDQGKPCGPGQTGRVVVTDLHNFAMPFIRYDIGDFAEVGPPCPCGRGLPVLSRIVGRTRNLLVTADGKRYYPFIGQSEYLDIAPILQHQLVQTALDVVEARIVMRDAPTSEQVERLQAHIARRMPEEGIRVQVVRVDSIPRSAGGKYEDFISLVDEP